MLDPPSRGVDSAEMALVRKGGHVALALGEQVDHLEPLGQRQLGDMKQGPGTHHRLGAAAGTLSAAPAIGVKARVFELPPLGTDKARQPAGARLRGLAFSLGAVNIEKLTQGHAAQELDFVLAHCSHFAAGRASQCAPPAGSGGEPAI